MSEDQPDRLIELRSWLRAFSPSEEALSPQERVVHVQEDLVLVASWGNSPEGKIITEELRGLYRQFTAANQPELIRTPPQELPKSDKEPVTQPSSGKLKSGMLYLKALFLATLAFFAVIIFFSISVYKFVPGELSVFLIAFAFWLGLFIFFKIAAPGVCLWKAKSPKVTGRTAGPWLAALGGTGLFIVGFLMSVGLGYIFPDDMKAVAYLLFLTIISVMAIIMGKSIARQPLGR